MAHQDSAFTGSIPVNYDRVLGPMLFAPYASDMAKRVVAVGPEAVLETAAGTGIVTLRLADSLPLSTQITATDLNQAMIDFAATKPAPRQITWQACDGTKLPFDDASFDCVVCQFGVMFFPSQLTGFQEAFRVLKPGGHYLFSVWDHIDANPIALAMSDALADRFPDDPPLFLRRTPYGHSDIDVTRQQLAEAGFASVEADIVSFANSCPSPRDAANGQCHGSPVRGEIEARDPNGIAGAAEAMTAFLAERFGPGRIDSTMRAIIFTARR
ncbi:class I SAM-dependent methyltransferase [Tabrizicola sp.]|uniref:class I SAM-dependent methyltransferase n=1 Tax=Tabrizicola sp. TaxID=2005166 RepID=UPI002736DBCC|nr:class I SAM-dependent methyltransferase [Tabrizicola sp.]MDP3197057.1 methyltransferase domain-containing protein [Tabrizicola sp.]